MLLMRIYLKELGMLLTGVISLTLLISIFTSYSLLSSSLLPIYIFILITVLNILNSPKLSTNLSWINLLPFTRKQLLAFITLVKGAQFGLLFLVSMLFFHIVYAIDTGHFPSFRWVNELFSLFLKIHSTQHWLFAVFFYLLLIPFSIGNFLWIFPRIVSGPNSQQHPTKAFFLVSLVFSSIYFFGYLSLWLGMISLFGWLFISPIPAWRHSLLLNQSQVKKLTQVSAICFLLLMGESFFLLEHLRRSDSPSYVATASNFYGYLYSPHQSIREFASIVQSPNASPGHRKILIDRFRRHFKSGYQFNAKEGGTLAYEKLITNAQSLDELKEISNSFDRNTLTFEHLNIYLEQCEKFSEVKGYWKRDAVGIYLDFPITEEQWTSMIDSKKNSIQFYALLKARYLPSDTVLKKLYSKLETLSDENFPMVLTTIHILEGRQVSWRELSSGAAKKRDVSVFNIDCKNYAPQSSKELMGGEPVLNRCLREACAASFQGKCGGIEQVGWISFPLSVDAKQLIKETYPYFRI